MPSTADYTALGSIIGLSGDASVSKLGDGVAGGSGRDSGNKSPTYGLIKRGPLAR